jgi:hypothetical protein
MAQDLSDMCFEQSPQESPKMFNDHLRKANTMELRGYALSEESCEEIEEKKFVQTTSTQKSHFLPALMQFSLKQVTMDSLSQNEFHLVCKESVKFMSKMKYVYIHSKNPLTHNKKLRKILKLRRTVHKLFDQIKCSEWDKFFVHCSSDESPTKRSKTVVVKSNKIYPDIDCNSSKDDTDSVYFGKNIQKIKDLKKYKNLVLRECYLTFE